MNCHLQFRTLFQLVVSVSAAFLSAATLAQGTFPTKPIHIVAASAPGGGGDLIARAVADQLRKRFTQSVVVENISGASGLIAYRKVMAAQPDAHTLFIGSSSSYNAVMHASKIADPTKAVTPVAQITTQPLLLLVTSTLPINNMKELMAYGKKNADALNFASPSIGSTAHLVGEILNQKTGLKMVHVPFKGIGPSLTEAAAGRIQVVFTSPSAAAPHVRTGKLRIIAASTAKRSVTSPNIPTMSEQGVDIDWYSWVGAFTTYGSPRQSVLILNKAINESITSPEMVKMFASDGADPAPGTPEQFGQVAEHVRNTSRKLMEEMGIEMAD